MTEKKSRFEGMSQAEINHEVMNPSSYWQWRTERFSPSTLDTLVKRKLDVMVRITERVRGPAVWTNDMTDVVLNGDVPEPLFEEWVRLAEEDKRLRAEQKPKRPGLTPFIPPTLAGKYFEAMEAKETREDEQREKEANKGN